MKSIEEREKNLKEFNKRWSLEKVKKMTIDEYCLDYKNHNYDSFCYWLEQKTKNIINIMAAPAIAKYCVYKYRNQKEGFGISIEGKYAWKTMYGNTPKEAFETIKSRIINVIELTKKNNKEKIEKIVLPHVVKWKIAILYSPENYVTIVAKDVLEKEAERQGLPDAKNKKFYELQNYLVSKRPKNKHYLEYSDEIRERSRLNPIKQENGNIILSQENFNLLIEKHLQWYEDTEHAKYESPQEYKKFNQKSYWQNLTDSEFIDVLNKFCINGGYIQSGGKRYSGQFKENLKKNTQTFREKILEIFNDNFDVYKWWEEVNKLTKEGHIKYFGVGIRSILLHRISPDKYPVFNNKTAKGLLRLGLVDKELSNSAENYKLIKEKIDYLITKSNQRLKNYYVADSLFHYIIGTKEGKELMKSLKNNDKHNESLENLIEIYKKHIKNGGLDDEIYKWEYLHNYQGRPNLDSEDFYDEIKTTDYANLLYPLSYGVLKDIAEVNSEELRECFRELFDENKDLKERIDEFSTKTKELYSKIRTNEKAGHHQDERAIATYLTYYYPLKYTFYTSTFYTAYCKFLNIKMKRAGEKYIHYLELVNELIENYIKKDNELQEIFNELIPDEYKDVHSERLIAQDFLFQVFQKFPSKFLNDTNYWVFQANPERYNVISALKDNNLKSWSVTAHKDEIKKGDKVILWVTGNNAGCYALCTVTSDVYEGTDDEVEKQYYTEESTDEAHDGVDINIDYNLAEIPILKDEIHKYKELKGLKVGSQGTNFTATKEQYDKLLELAKIKLKVQYWIYAPGKNAEFWNEFYEKGIMGLGWNDIGDLSRFKTKEEMEKAVAEIYGSEGDNKKINIITALDDFKNNIKIGDIVIAKDGRQKLLGWGIVKSDYYYDEKRTTYQKCRKVDWQEKGEWKLSFRLPLKTLTNWTNNEHLPKIIELLDIEQKIFQKLLNLFDEKNRSQYFGFLRDVVKHFALKKGDQRLVFTTGANKLKFIIGQRYCLVLYRNQKDYNFSVISDEIISEKYEEFEGSGPKAYLNYFNTLKISEQEKQSIFNAIQTELQRTIKSGFRKNNNEAFENYVFKKQIFPIPPNTILYGPPGTGKTYSIFDKAVEIVAKSKYKENDHEHNVDVFRKYLNKRIFFITFHQNYGYEEFVGGLRPKETGEQLNFTWKPGVFLRACAAAFKDNSNDAVTEEDVKAFLEACEKNTEDLLKENGYKREHNVVLIIDEINRANISRVFGELITLIEEDKRIGGKHGLILTLPGGKKFGVPSNLVLLGTMNTADKSIAHLDAALRRRFSFVPLYPDIELIDDDTKKEFLKKLNKNLFDKKKSADLLIGHSYFVGKESLEDIIKNNILPLLMEYFSNDIEKVKDIFKDTGVSVDYKTENYKWEITVK